MSAPEEKPAQSAAELSSLATAPKRNVILVDVPARWMRRPDDLAIASLALIGLAITILLAIYGSATTLAITKDVRSIAERTLEIVLGFPTNVIEGILSFFLPLLIVVEWIWYRRWRTLYAALAAGATSVAITSAIAWVSARFFPISEFTQLFHFSLQEQSYITMFPYVAVLSALLSVNTQRIRWVFANWGWPLLFIALALSIIQGNQNLPGALISVLTGVMCGRLARFITGDTPERATGLALINLVRRAGIDATHVVRLDSPSGEELLAWRARTNAPLSYVDRFGLNQLRSLVGDSAQPFSSVGDPDSTPTLEDPEKLENTPDLYLDPTLQPERIRADFLTTCHPPLSHAASRNYLVRAIDGSFQVVALLDLDRHIVGILATLWKKITLLTSKRRAERTIEDSAEHMLLSELAAMRAGVAPQRAVSVSHGSSSVLVGYSVEGDTTLATLPEGTFNAAMACELWDIVLRAHERGLSHGNICADTVALRDGHVVLVNWDNGTIAAGEVSRRIDSAQTLALLGALLGEEKAVAITTDVLPLDQLLSVAPILQPVIIPSATMALYPRRKAFDTLRSALAARIPAEEEIIQERLTRFSPRTVLTVSVGVVAIYLLLGSINFKEISELVTNAEPLWILASALCSLACYVGAALVLVAYTAEKLSVRETTFIQLAASVVNLIAPAGIGHAAINLRYLSRKKVSTAIAVATVSLVQVAQFLTTVALLIVLGLATGDVGTLAMPSHGFLLALGALIAVAAALMLIEPLRRWVWKKISPTITQIWPRLVWLGSSPRRILLGLAGAIVQTIAYVAAFGTSLAAFGYELPLVTLAITYLISNSVGAIVPSPGGIGPVEAALTVGLTAAGVPYSIAFSATLLFRLVTFWMPIPIGWLALRYSQKKNLI